MSDRKVHHRKTHGDRGEGSPYYHLYLQWRAMINRSKKRENCEVLFKDYPEFKKWALDNNWSKRLAVCRIGDIGNYEPNNCRIDTIGSNTIESLAKNFEFLSPNGMYVGVYNLSEFCRLNKLNTSAMCQVHKGKAKQHKGWTKYIKPV